MKIYFDTVATEIPNLNHLSSHENNNFWIVSSGTNLKRKLSQMKISYENVDDINEPGIYVIDVNGDPQWWCGVLKDDNVPQIHIIDQIPEKILNLVRDKKLRIIIAADKEGGGMISPYWNCFESTTDAMFRKKLPKDSVAIFQGNTKICQQYQQWLIDSNKDKMFEVIHSIHFNDIFFNSFLPDRPIVLESVKNERAQSFNSLNRVYRTHRGAHLYLLSKDQLLDEGLVSGNDINFLDESASHLLGIDRNDFIKIMEKEFPRFVDGDWSTINAANQYNTEIYKNSLMTVITETKYDEDVIFLTEKIFKPLALGHPVILIASPGTLSALKDLGFKIDWCGIDPSYNDIIDHRDRFIKTHQIIVDWIKTPQDEKIKRIERSMDTIQHNFDLMRSRNFYTESINSMLQNSEKYFDY